MPAIMPKRDDRFTPVLLQVTPARERAMRTGTHVAPRRRSPTDVPLPGTADHEAVDEVDAEQRHDRGRV